jgi:eukaryotic-like serine/threonine-protein kinase
MRAMRVGDKCAVRRGTSRRRPSGLWPRTRRRLMFGRSPIRTGVVRDPVKVLRPALAARYEIEREIAAGDASTLYLARDLRHDRPVVLKVLRAVSNTPTIDEARFVREIRLLARLQHPFILPLHDSGHVEEVIYYVAPYVTGESLRERIKRERKLPVDDALRIAAEVADALDCAHRSGVIHRGIKPSNILLSGGHAIVADFGIAIRAGESLSILQDGAEDRHPVGNLAYISPEQYRMEDGSLTVPSDIYALGGVLFTLLTGELPNGSTIEEIAETHHPDFGRCEPPRLRPAAG